MRLSHAALVGAITFAVLALLIMVFAKSAHAAEAEWFIQPLAHGSDPTDAGDSDPTFDFVGGGVTIYAKKFEFDLALGRKAIACSYRSRCKSSVGGMASVRWYPMRKERRR